MANYFQTGGGAARAGGGIVTLGGSKKPQGSAYFRHMMAQNSAATQPVLKQEPEQPATQPATQPAVDPPTSLPVPQTPVTPTAPTTPTTPSTPTTPDPRAPSTPVTPRPPVPPTPPTQKGPDTAGMADHLWKYAIGTMNNPSRYDADVVKQGAQVIEDTIARMRTAGTRSIGEWGAARGLTGSSLEGERMTDLNSELDAHAQERLFNLQREQANTFATDRSSAYGLGLGAGGLGEQIAGRMGTEDYRNRSLDQQRYFGDADIDYRNRSLDQDKWRTESGFERQDRGLDQNEAALYADLAARYGPDVLEQMGITPPGGTATTDTSNWWGGTRGTQPARRTSSYFNG